MRCVLCFKRAQGYRVPRAVRCINTRVRYRALNIVQATNVKYPSLHVTASAGLFSNVLEDIFAHT